ncbi:Rpn family recombination-promoting nuclease/putative transposase [Sporosarcina sp. ANT_H38]|uniref:Rpn family recombination-promoting nuclease/putative transposase n=1 Tax=Sporosarcina sp. ANT_H38 TaxID=2597358 RepID=UPI0011F172F3|nr:Rpn family recombination-promoting nuclease/putative transposase [Sporosarcina sp. ANT_H38]KAA0964844.1 Rpn family recombination-promoting nuclease/putative transposase [Sporosarcina sp. ANT_H38]
MLVSIVGEEQNVYAAELLDLRNDFVFKAFFADERNNNLLLQFLKAILGETITSVKLTDPTIEIAHSEDKSSVMDLRVITNDGEQINVEMQYQGHKWFPERMLMYWTKMYSSQDEVQKLYRQLKKAVQIVIVNFSLLPKSHYHSMFQLMDPEDSTIFSSHLEIHVLELPKLQVESIIEMNDLEKWLLFMKSDKKTKEALAVESSTLKEALSQIERLSQNPETRRMAISREIHLKDQLQREEDAESRGVEQGKEVGANLRDREIVLNMYAENLPAESIAQLTKIPLEKVKGIIESIVQ